MSAETDRVDATARDLMKRLEDCETALERCRQELREAQEELGAGWLARYWERQAKHLEGQLEAEHKGDGALQGAFARNAELEAKLAECERERDDYMRRELEARAERDEAVGWTEEVLSLAGIDDGEHVPAEHVEETFRQKYERVVVDRERIEELEAKLAECEKQRAYADEVIASYDSAADSNVARSDAQGTRIKELEAKLAECEREKARDQELAALAGCDSVSDLHAQLGHQIDRANKADAGWAQCQNRLDALHRRQPCGHERRLLEPLTRSKPEDLTCVGCKLAECEREIDGFRRERSELRKQAENAETMYAREAADLRATIEELKTDTCGRSKEERGR